MTRRRESRLQQDSEPESAPYYTLDQYYTSTVGRLALYAQDEWSIGFGVAVGERRLVALLVTSTRQSRRLD